MAVGCVDYVAPGSYEVIAIGEQFRNSVPVLVGSGNVPTAEIDLP